MSGYYEMVGTPPANPTNVRQCVKGCNGCHSPKVRCLECFWCGLIGHLANNCYIQQTLYCTPCKKKGHITAKCRLHSSDNDKQVKVGNHNLIEAEAVNEATVMNIGQRSHTSPTLAPKRGGPGGGSGLVSSTFIWAPRWREPSPWKESLRPTSLTL